MHTLLHLETSLFYKKIMHEICSELGISYFCAPGTDEAFSILRSNSISMVLTAMELEGGNSEKFISSLNASEFKNIPVIVFTGNDTLEARKAMYDLGIVDFILKTTDREVIKHSISIFNREDPMSSAIGSLNYAVLDDSALDCKVIDRIFAMHGIKNTDYYHSGKDLLAAGKKYDVYLIDIVLKDTSGDKIITAIREQNDQAVLIAISGIDNVKTISRVLSIGASDYITKPFNYEIFIARLKTNIRNYLLLCEVKAKTAQLEKMAITDSLTGISNRRHLFEVLAVETEKARRYGSSFSLLMFDIDYFKKLNDTYGHQHGDEVLKKVAEVLKSSIRTVDVAGRYGGEEFLVILTESDIDGSIAVAERIRREAAKIDNGPVTISGGVTIYSGETAEDLLKKADMLLYRAKNEGRNRVCH
jgi:diguanylate cyclase (GGDEF)-like protein